MQNVVVLIAAINYFAILCGIGNLILPEVRAQLVPFGAGDTEAVRYPPSRKGGGPALPLPHLHYGDGGASGRTQAVHWRDRVDGGRPRTTRSKRRGRPRRDSV